MQTRGAGKHRRAVVAEQRRPSRAQVVVALGVAAVVVVVALAIVVL